MPVPATIRSSDTKIQSDSWLCRYWASVFRILPTMANTVAPTSPAEAAYPSAWTRQSIAGPACIR